MSSEERCVRAVGRLPVHCPDVFTTRSTGPLSRGRVPAKTLAKCQEGEGKGEIAAGRDGAQTDISEERSHRGPHSSPAFRHSAAQHQRAQPQSAGDEEQTRLFTVEQQYNFVVWASDGLRFNVATKAFTHQTRNETTTGKR